MINTIAVIGAGTMGNGIAHVFAQHGFTTILTDINEESLQKALTNIRKNTDRQISKGTLTQPEQEAMFERLDTTTNLQKALHQADLVVEAATENVEIKLNLFKEADFYAPEHCILATNTSSISITKIASVTKRPAQVIGMHFMNPVPVMKLVEIINGYSTSAETTTAVEALSHKLGKVPCVVNDYPGFVANRILMPMINEAIHTLHEGVAGVEAIDTVMKLGMAHPMGPLQLADFIGLDVCLSIMRVLYDGFGQPKYVPSPLLVNMVQAGRLGVKSGEGFYTYTAGSKELVVSDAFRN